ncbi:MAG TPA: DUF502 domain-containing protein [candidate division Zixibacteria bacterium]
MSIRSKLNTALRRYFLSGILVIVPLIITFLVLRFLLSGVDGILSPIINKLVGRNIPGLGVVATIILIFIAGALTANVIGSRLFKIWEIFFIKTPLVRTIYGSSKQLVQALTNTDKHSFKQVVMVEFPRKGIYTFGFMTNEMKIDLLDTNDKMISVFIPSTPTPFSGWTLLFRHEDVIPLDISVEDGIKFFVSGGIASPSVINQTDIISPE